MTNPSLPSTFYSSSYLRSMLTTYYPVVRMYLYTPRWFSSETSVGHSNWPSCYNDFALGWRKSAHAEKAAHYHPILKLTDSCYYLHRSCILMSLHFSEEAAQPCPWRLARLCGQSAPWRVDEECCVHNPKRH